MVRRSSIPTAIVEAVLIESGHRCAVCGAPCPLEKAHITPWHKSRDNSAENLLCLCANCHARADNERWGERVLRAYKKQPWISRQSAKGFEVTPREVVEITIEKDYEIFDEYQENLLRHALANFLQVGPQYVRILSRKKGSIRIVIELPIASAHTLVAAFSSGELADALPFFSVTGLKLLQPESYACDVLIIGAGLAGLSLARQLLLTDPELRILMLEHRHQVPLCEQKVGEATVQA